MSFIFRHKINGLESYLLEDHPRGIILSGVVGAGKTTVVDEVCRRLVEKGFETLKFDGDDVAFRTTIRQNSQLFVEEIASRGLQKPLIFVDEAQKEPEIFDALKIAFDKKNASFIVSGSNPAFLRTVARERLQRRAAGFSLHPLTLPELALHEGLLTSINFQLFNDVLWNKDERSLSKLPVIKRPKEIDALTQEFLVRGGLPLAVKSKSLKQSLQQIKLTAERGISETFVSTVAQSDEVRRYLAFANAREFTYQGLQQKLRSSKRQLVDSVIDHLMNHGYLFKKRPYLENYEGEKSTYLASYSWIDPGIVSYFQGDDSPSDQELGFRLEAYIHTRLVEHLETIPLQSQIYYHKPFSWKESIEALSFKPGEIDFIVAIGKHVIPMEVKLTEKISDIDTSLLEDYMRSYRRKLGIVIYGGSFYFNEGKGILYFPYWYI